MSRQYLNASRAIDAVVLERKTLKSYCSKNKIGKLEYALITETLKYKTLLDDLFQACNISSESLDVRYGMLLVMSYELLFGSKKIQGGGKVKRALLSIQNVLQDQLNEMSTNDPLYALKEKQIDYKYARVNEIKITIQEAIQQLQLTYIDIDISIDIHIPTLLVIKNMKKGKLFAYMICITVYKHNKHMHNVHMHNVYNQTCTNHTSIAVVYRFRRASSGQDRLYYPTRQSFMLSLTNTRRYYHI